MDLARKLVTASLVESQLSRRALLRASAAAGGGLLVTLYLPFAEAAESSGSEPNAEPFAPNAFIRISRQGKVTLIIPQAEMGQGVYTSLAMILAEELDAAFDQVAVEAAPPNEALYANPAFGIQATGNSNSVRAFWDKLRLAGAGARDVLVQAAAAQWKVSMASCTTELGEVVHSASGRRLGYGALADAATLLTPPTKPALKRPEDFKLVGTSLKRLDTPDKVNGKARYAIDIIPDGVKVATIAACPVFGGKLAHVDDAAAKAVPGVRQVVVLDDMVAVVGDHMWAAKKGLEALVITWNEGQNAEVNSALIWAHIKAASEEEGAVAKAKGDANKALQEGELVEASFELPFLAHATMEPMNCTVHVRSDGCEVWAGTQVCARAQAIAAKVTGLPLEKVVVHNQLLGGGFGRRLEVDYVEKAVRVAQKVDGPVKVVWTREEDIQHDIYRPVYYDRLSATLKDGKINGWKHRITGSSIVARWLPPAYTHDVDFDAVDSAVDEPYDIPNFLVEYVRHEPPAVPTGFWRGVGPNNNIFAIESFVDELAKKAGSDPVEFRRALLGEKSPRLKAGLELAAQKSGWGDPLPARVGRGVALQVSFATFHRNGRRGRSQSRRRDTCATHHQRGRHGHRGQPRHHSRATVIFGLTAALYGEITISKGRVEQSNFNDYRMLRIDEVPAIDVHLIKSGEAPGGIGETGTNAAPTAVRNAIFAATGIPLRRLPFDRKMLAGKA